MLTRSILAWDLTGKATALALVNLAVSVPMIFASLLGGAITDRVERRQLTIYGQCLILANEVTILTLLSFDSLQFWHMLCTAFISGCAFPFIMPARMAITFSAVGPRLIQDAMAFSSGVMNLSRVAGPAVMGVIIARFSISSAYMVSCTLYVLAIACMFGVKPSRSEGSEGQQKALLADIVQGFTYLGKNRPLLVCLLFGCLPMFVVMPVQSILVMLAEQSWQQGESGVGVLMAVGGIGAVFGSIWMVKRGNSDHRLTLMVGSFLGLALLLAVFAQTPVFYIALLPLLLANIFASAGQTINGVAVQLLVDDKLRGRISSFMMMSFGLTPIGVVPLALAADHIGAANAISIACAILVVAVIVFYLASPSLRNLDNLVKRRL